MKLFFWGDPVKIGYGGSAVFAVAANEKAARKQIEKNCKRYAYFLDSPEEHIGMHLELGPPSRVVDLPCAEYHWWSE